ncbi:hypothetical protein DRW41_15740 [Neobacillus piezotolerans]|uniref:BioF2-like acetyltransferase domain-containing protein n=1 Tax=Neobacillus piezotolerans TaxID=2259171 RepID=A0A3D8GNP0_9BACI|nr:hypothetical protein [Neobacillus piezotolerans]RDU36038.1 hypothetical protein DRW41_15740 [Neobacillus piezotolerans]
MLSISRTRWGIQIQQIYFPKEPDFHVRPSTDLVGITQSIVPIEGLKPIETLQQDLSKREEALFGEISKSARQQIKQAGKTSGLFTFINVNPSDEDITVFQEFYNKAADRKHTDRCTDFHVEKLKLLRDQKALVMTKIEGEGEGALCYRVYAADGERAMPFYSASHFRLTGDSQFRRLVGKAHRLLKWENILWFKNNGYLIYDSGGLTPDPNVRNFKLEFGGTIKTEYSGYLPYSTAGKLVLKVRNLKSHW